MRFAAVLLVVALPCPTSAERSDSVDPARPEPLQISGIYPHLAVFNQPDDVADRTNHGECGTGAIVPWVGKLWVITYPQHKVTGSNDKLYEIAPDMSVTIRPESVGGTHACRMIHRESNQLIIGPYFIDAYGRVRSVDLQQLRGRMTAVMRHLTDPANKVYYYDMEGALYEVDVHTLAVRLLFAKPVPGWHGKGGYTAQGRVVIANNGESGGTRGYDQLLVGGPARGDEAGVLAEWDGREWRIVERAKFTDVTGPGGISGSPSDDSPLWAVGWDKRSVVLKLLDGGEWHTFRLPKASHSFDPDHGWYTEWPRIREIAPGRPMLCMHGGMFDFPSGFRAADTSGIRPIGIHLRYIPDFCYWGHRVVLGADDASMMQNPMCGQGQSNLWFGHEEELAHFGPRAGWGGVWLGDEVEAGQPSDPFLIAGYDQRVLHLANDGSEPVRFNAEVDLDGRGQWVPLASYQVPVAGYRSAVLPEDLKAEWIRVTPSIDCRATAYLHCWSPRQGEDGEERLFDGLADADGARDYTGGIIRPAAHNRSLQWWARDVERSGTAMRPRYVEVNLSPEGTLSFELPVEDRGAEVERVGAIGRRFRVGEASVIVTDRTGQRFRLPKGPPAFDRPFATGWPRAVREVVSERYLANIHGTFYEVPREPGPDGHEPDFERMKPVASHGKVITDFCTWRGLLVLSGVRRHAAGDGQCFSGPDGSGLWFGAIDDLWKLGKPVGRGGPWFHTSVEADQASDPYLMANYDEMRVELSHDAPTAVSFAIEVNFDHMGFREYGQVSVPPSETQVHRFPRGFRAHWVRFRVGAACRATAMLIYE
ncbi:MAG TPA: hypothetical protein PLD23_14785 [Armatimonadota bacterium]|nr:hypothetical protein [Armatimonadota bacterium]